MKRLARRISVETKKGWPTRLYVEGQTLVVTRLLDYWVREGKWWAGEEREERRVYFRVQIRGATLEIYCSGEEWTLARILD